MAVESSRLIIQASVVHAATAPTPDIGTAEPAVHRFNRAVDIALAAGAGAGQADRFWSDTRTLTASANEDLDLAGAALLDAFGVAVTFARVKALVVIAAPGNTNNVVVGAAGANPWIGAFNAAGTTTLKPGGAMALFCSSADPVAWPVVAGTGDLLRIANSGAGSSVSYDIAIVGASA